MVREIRAGTSAADRQRAAFVNGNPLRQDVHEAMRELERLIKCVRSEGIRILVDSGQMTLTDVARLLGISPTMARRLYRSARPETG